MSDELSLVRLLNRLVRTPLTGLDEAVTETIGAACAEIGAACGCLFRLSGGHLIADAQYTTPGKSPPLLDAGGLFKTYHLRLEAGETLRMPVDGCDQSFLAMPIHGTNGLSGVLGFCFDDEAVDLQDSALSRLAAVAEIIETVLERQEREVLHRTTAQRLEATLAALPDLLFEVTADGRFAELSAGPRHLMLVPHDQLKDRPVADFLPATWRPSCMRPCGQPLPKDRSRACATSLICRTVRLRSNSAAR